MTQCCGEIGGWNTLQPEEPNVRCYDKQQNEYVRVIAADAKILLDRYGINPCLIPGTGRISRQDVETYLKTVVY